jgi:hypothetical protein
VHALPIKDSLIDVCIRICEQCNVLDSCPTNMLLRKDRRQPI